MKENFLKIKVILTLFVKMVTGKNLYNRHRHWNGIIEEIFKVKRTEIPQTSRSIVKWSEDVEPCLSDVQPTAVLESLTCGDDPGFHSNVG